MVGVPDALRAELEGRGVNNWEKQVSSRKVSTDTSAWRLGYRVLRWADGSRRKGRYGPSAFGTRPERRGWRRLPYAP